jgi:hypothetical protein
LLVFALTDNISLSPDQYPQSPSPSGRPFLLFAVEVLPGRVAPYADSSNYAFLAVWNGPVRSLLTERVSFQRSESPEQADTKIGVFPI